MTSSAPTATEQPHFSDRADAGRQLAARLTGFRRLDPVVVGVAPDGMPVAAEVARALEAPLQPVAVEPLSLGGHSFGAAAEGGVALFEHASSDEIDAEPEEVDAAIASAQQRLTERAHAWLHGTGRQSLHGRQVLLVGDVLQDDETAAAAACSVRDRGAAKVTYAAALVRPAAEAGLVDWVEEIVCLGTLPTETPAASRFSSYEPVPDEQVRALLRGNGTVKASPR